ncbi:MAG: sel1 repeat family protein [Methylobacteriaceae bacterium]|nr:sel1 repeat family protein [Methylobacteriaceae bacterium]
MKKAGGAAIRVAVYPGVHHSFESTGGIGEVPQDWASTHCAGRFLRDENFILYDRASGKRATSGSQTDYLFSTCLKRGYLVGGDGRVKAQASADLLQFLRDVDVLQDEAARAVTPDCASLPEGVLRIVCARARAGWSADLVGMARAYLHGPLPRDPARAAALFELAAARGHARAQWELSLLLRQGAGVARDLPRALALAKSSAEAGEAIGMNIYGVMIRDGIARPADDLEARIWFERADELMDSYAAVNLARYQREGKAGLARAPDKAIALLRKAIARDDNPWGLVMLADMMEQGEGAPRDLEAARGFYRAAAAQEREPAARERASQALARMGR